MNKIYMYKAILNCSNENKTIEFYARNDSEADKRLDELTIWFCSYLCVDAKIVSKCEVYL